MPPRTYRGILNRCLRKTNRKETDSVLNVRETATKTNSLVDRLKAIKLPAVDSVADNLETKTRAEELDTETGRTEEIEIVEEAVGE